MTEQEETRVRKHLWLTHGCSGHVLYGDDGEMQCNVCRIDFVRDSITAILDRLNTLNKERCYVPFNPDGKRQSFYTDDVLLQFVKPLKIDKELARFCPNQEKEPS